MSDTDLANSVYTSEIAAVMGSTTSYGHTQHGSDLLDQMGSTFDSQLSDFDYIDQTSQEDVNEFGAKSQESDNFLLVPDYDHGNESDCEASTGTVINVATRIADETDSDSNDPDSSEQSKLLGPFKENTNHVQPSCASKQPKQTYAHRDKSNDFV